MTSTRFGIFLLAWMLASGTVVGGEHANWVTVFDEQFTDNPSERFKILSVPNPGSTSSKGAGQYDEEQQAYLLEGRLSLVRPVRAGAHVEWSLTLGFEPPGTDASANLETDLMLVLFDHTMAGVQIQRSKPSDAPAIVRFVQEKPGQTQTKVLREFQLPGPPSDGVWSLRYRHGLLTLVQGNETVGNADLELLGVQVAGVSWIQKGGVVTCSRMTLQGEPFCELTAKDQETLQRASRLNEQAENLFRNKKTEDALHSMQEASALFLSVHGVHHYDSANSLTNLASIMDAMGERDGASKLWAEALAIHEATLGSTHPHTTLTRFNFGTNALERGDRAKAKELWTRCRDDWKAVLGPDYPLVKSLDSILPTL